MRVHFFEHKQTGGLEKQSQNSCCAAPGLYRDRPMMTLRLNWKKRGENAQIQILYDRFMLNNTGR